MSQSGNPPPGENPPDEDPKTQIRPAGSPTAPQYDRPGQPTGSSSPDSGERPAWDQKPAQQPGASSGGQYGQSYEQQYGQQYGQPGSYGQRSQPGYGQQYGQSGEQYGQQYGQYGAPPSPYGQQYGGASPYGQPQGGPTGGYAGWGDRVVATLWDFLYQWPALICWVPGVILVPIGASIGGTTGGILIGLGVLGALALWGWGLWRFIYNYFIDQGRSGYTYGKRKVGVRLVVEASGQAPGAGSCVGRYFLHAIINYACFIDYLWPLWDEKSQTLTDKVLGTVVVQWPEAPR